MSDAARIVVDSDGGDPLIDVHAHFYHAASGRGDWERVNAARMRAGADSLSRTIITLQGNGDYAGVGALYARYGTIGPVLQGDLARLQTRGIPVDIVYDQGR